MHQSMWGTATDWNPGSAPDESAAVVVAARWRRGARVQANRAGPGLGYVAVVAGSSRTITVSATLMISSTGRSAASAWLRMASGLEAW